MTIWTVVIGRGGLDRRSKRYMKRVLDGVITYHLFKPKIHTWSTKYGPYNTIKERAGSATFYNVGQSVDIVVCRELDIVVDPKSVAIGYNF